jgi:hypothetical protein
MSGPPLWLSFLDEAHRGPAPWLRGGASPDSPVIELTDRARWVLAAISLPRELAPEAASDERQRLRLGSRLWSSGEITARIPYQHRSTIRHALTDLRRRLEEHGLVLEHYLVIDTDRGCYGVRHERVTVDLIELHAARNRPDELDRRLDAALGDRKRAEIAAMCSNLLADPVFRELDEAITASAARASVPAAPGPAPDAQRTETPSAALPGETPPAPERTGAAPAPERTGAAPAPEPAGTATGPAPAGPAIASAPVPERTPPSPTGPGSRRGRRRRTLLLPALVVVLIAAAAVVPVLASGKGHTRIHGLGPPRAEVSGGVAHTWSNPHVAGGRAGREIMGGESVLIACRLRGFKVQDGNVWWYLIDSRPWSRRFFVTADTFYNDGRTSGSLRGSAFVDPRVARCS